MVKIPVQWLSILWATCLLLAPMSPAADVPFSASGENKRSTALPLITVRKNQFVTPEGKPVVFRGLALSDPAALQHGGNWNRAYFEAARSWSANVVRVPVHPQFWRERGEEAYLKLLDEAVQWSGELGMYVIIDWHTIGNVLRGVYHRPMYITSRDETFRFWYAIAERYRGNTVVPFYELYNEPTNRNGEMGRMPWSEYKAFVEELIEMIRHIEPNAIPLVAGFDWGYDLSHVRKQPIAFPGVAYVTHPYPQKRNQPWEAQWQKEWGYVAEKYPVFATELGFMSADGPGAHNPVIADEEYGEAIVRFMEARGISWTPWVFDPEWSPQLLADWNFTPSRQGRFFRAKMQQLNR